MKRINGEEIVPLSYAEVYAKNFNGEMRRRLRRLVSIDYTEETVEEHIYFILQKSIECRYLLSSYTDNCNEIEQLLKSFVERSTQTFVKESYNNALRKAKNFEEILILKANLSTNTADYEP